MVTHTGSEGLEALRSQGTEPGYRHLIPAGVWLMPEHVLGGQDTLGVSPAHPPAWRLSAWLSPSTRTWQPRTHPVCRPLTVGQPARAGPEDAPRDEQGAVLRPLQMRSQPAHGLAPCAHTNVISGEENAF